MAQKRSKIKLPQDELEVDELIEDDELLVDDELLLPVPKTLAVRAVARMPSAPLIKRSPQEERLFTFHMLVMSSAATALELPDQDHPR